MSKGVHRQTVTVTGVNASLFHILYVSFAPVILLGFRKIVDVDNLEL